ncbi:MAG: hypothetical protein KGI69_03280 [Patescibacteria group bacterium]|nr:hypothetical protein [Patescibacteria group bacterium]
MKEAADQNVPPVLLMLFNRADTTRKVFETVRAARPSKLFIAANGPRPNMASDIDKCRAVREIFSGIDWECDVHTNFREKNIGMQPHWRLALDWFFEGADAGIILEDDCVPHPSFFGYCGELLKRYKDEPRIMHINGSNFQFGIPRGDASYYFSRYPHVWGWATWKRAWQGYDDSLSTFPRFEKDDDIGEMVSDRRQRDYWMKFFRGLRDGRYDTCDAKWIYSIWANDGLCITPNTNLIENIGYGAQATHTFHKDRILGQSARDIRPISHPAPVYTADRAADDRTFEVYFKKNLLQKALYKIRQHLS